MNLKALTLAGLASFTFLPTCAIAAQFIPLGGLSGPGQTSTPWDISDDGSTVVGESNDLVGFRWTALSGMTPLANFTQEEGESYGYGVTADGSLVVGAAQALEGIQAARWFAADAPEHIIDPQASGISAASDVSADGAVIIGGEATSFPGNVFYWTAETGAVSFSSLPGVPLGAGPSAVSPDGEYIVGGYQSQAFRWSESSGMLSLGDLPGGEVSSSARDVSNNGAVVVGSSETDEGTEAFRWTEEDGMIGLGDFPGGAVSSHAYGVSADGTVIVGSSDDGMLGAAFMWDSDNGLQSIQELLETKGVDLTGWKLWGARAVSGDGTVITGVGLNPTGNAEGWVAILSDAPIPEPSALTLLAVGLLPYCAFRVRKRLTRHQ